MLADFVLPRPSFHARQPPRRPWRSAACASRGASQSTGSATRIVADHSDAADGRLADAGNRRVCAAGKIEELRGRRRGRRAARAEKRKGTLTDAGPAPEFRPRRARIRRASVRAILQKARCVPICCCACIFLRTSMSYRGRSRHTSEPFAAARGAAAAVRCKPRSRPTRNIEAPACPSLTQRGSGAIIEDGQHFHVRI